MQVGVVHCTTVSPTALPPRAGQERPQAQNYPHARGCVLRIRLPRTSHRPMRSVRMQFLRRSFPFRPDAREAGSPWPPVHRLLLGLRDRGAGQEVPSAVGTVIHPDVSGARRLGQAARSRRSAGCSAFRRPPAPPSLRNLGIRRERSISERPPRGKPRQRANPTVHCH
jgi:hypothetical protein